LRSDHLTAREELFPNQPTTPARMQRSQSGQGNGEENKSGPAQEEKVTAKEKLMAQLIQLNKQFLYAKELKQYRLSKRTVRKRQRKKEGPSLESVLNSLESGEFISLLQSAPALEGQWKLSAKKNRPAWSLIEAIARELQLLSSAVPVADGGDVPVASTSDAIVPETSGLPLDGSVPGDGHQLEEKMSSERLLGLLIQILSKFSQILLREKNESLRYKMALLFPRVEEWYKVVLCPLMLSGLCFRFSGSDGVVAATGSPEQPQPLTNFLSFVGHLIEYQVLCCTQLGTRAPPLPVIKANNSQEAAALYRLYSVMVADPHSLLMVNRDPPAPPASSSSSVRDSHSHLLFVKNRLSTGAAVLHFLESLRGGRRSEERGMVDQDGNRIVCWRGTDFWSLHLFKIAEFIGILSRALSSETERETQNELLNHFFFLWKNLLPRCPRGGCSAQRNFVAQFLDRNSEQYLMYLATWRFLFSISEDNSMVFNFFHCDTVMAYMLEPMASTLAQLSRRPHPSDPPSTTEERSLFEDGVRHMGGSNSPASFVHLDLLNTVLGKLVVSSSSGRLKVEVLGSVVLYLVRVFELEQETVGTVSSVQEKIRCWTRLLQGLVRSMASEVARSHRLLLRVVATFFVLMGPFRGPTNSVECDTTVSGFLFSEGDPAKAKGHFLHLAVVLSLLDEGTLQALGHLVDFDFAPLVSCIKPYRLQELFLGGMENEEEEEEEEGSQNFYGYDVVTPPEFMWDRKEEGQQGTEEERKEAREEEQKKHPLRFFKDFVQLHLSSSSSSSSFSSSSSSSSSSTSSSSSSSSSVDVVESRERQIERVHRLLGMFAEDARSFPEGFCQNVLTLFSARHLIPKILRVLPGSGALLVKFLQEGFLSPSDRLPRALASRIWATFNPPVHPSLHARLPRGSDNVENVHTFLVRRPALREEAQAVFKLFRDMSVGPGSAKFHFSVAKYLASVFLQKSLATVGLNVTSIIMTYLWSPPCHFGGKLAFASALALVQLIEADDQGRPLSSSAVELVEADDQGRPLSSSAVELVEADDQGRPLSSSAVVGSSSAVVGSSSTVVGSSSAVVGSSSGGNKKRSIDDEGDLVSGSSKFRRTS
jgi:hypothetical protein